MMTSKSTLPSINGVFTALSQKYGLTPRASQLRLAELVRQALSTGGICALEAPTGTGKTLGYLAGALDAQAHAAKPIPIVVATATVGLQAQIIRHDIPRLAELGLVESSKVAVAKGRGRYFCPRTAALLEDKKMQDNQTDMFAQDKYVADAGTEIALDMLRAWKEKEWDGDKDSWQGSIPKCWDAACGANSDTCVNRACEHFSSCPYMASRAKLGNAQVIIANHDMVLADLLQRAEGQNVTALPPKAYALIFDEAHNLPEKAVGTRRASARLTDIAWLTTLEQYGEVAMNVASIQKAIWKASNVSPNVFSVGATVLAGMLREVHESLAQQPFDINRVYSWKLTTPPTNLIDIVMAATAKAFELVAALKITAKEYAELAEASVGVNKAFAVRQLALTNKFHRQADELHRGLEMFCTTGTVVRWAYRDAENKITLNVQPLEGKDVLESLLWGINFPIALVSATLQISGSFQRFKNKCGLPEHAVTEALPPVFDYSRGYLHLPNMKCSPGESGYESELVSKIELLHAKNVEHGASDGMLILFTSRESMRRVVGALNSTIRDLVLMQTQAALPELIAQHKARIDSGLRSILVGLDSMAEGLDLPGKYCSHVVITRLPFAVPGDPIEDARRDYLGKAWFEEAYLADMLTMLIQSTGRLIRREDDHGVITLLDNRLQTKRYGDDVIRALPNFTYGTKLAVYYQMAKERGFDLSHGVPHNKPLNKTSHEKVLKKMPEKCINYVVPVEKEKLAGVPSRKDPLSLIWRALTITETTSALGCDITTLMSALNRCKPHKAGPFPADEPAYLPGSVPCLPAGLPAFYWTERRMPQSVMLGIYLKHVPWNGEAEDWFKLLLLRPDLVQFGQILRSHSRGWPDVRTNLISEAICAQQVAQGLKAFGLSSNEQLFLALDHIEEKTLSIVQQPHCVPGNEFFNELPNAAFDLKRQLIEHRKVA